jgi:hypothetical protein
LQRLAEFSVIEGSIGIKYTYRIVTYRFVKVLANVWKLKIFRKSRPFMEMLELLKALALRYKFLLFYMLQALVACVSADYLLR